MRLKSLEIKGFKSFANQTIIKFDEGVTGVVGPNGSGKSNIVDSIRWVLGEQKSKELRLESMGDVIFNGTKKKKKSGAAQVTLTFENTKNILPTEYKEVSISRTLYRSGESEYQLNNVKCRLKDIRNLFLDSGIGSNTYAIIELGMVDSILSDKENARRKMFEQAAGISKYKIRKKEALNKLQLTKADLDRVEDLLFELETNMKSLEKQARRTERFYKIKEDYKLLKVQVSKAKITTYEADIFSIATKQKERHDHLTQILSSIRNAESDLEQLKTKNLKGEKELSELQKSLNQLVARIQEFEGAESLRKQEISFLRTSETRLYEEQSKLKEGLASLKETLVNKEHKLKLESEKQEKLQEAFTKLEAEYIEFRSKVEDEHAQSNEQQRELLNLQKSSFETEKLIVQLDGKISLAKNQLLRMESDKQDKADLIKQLQEDLKGLESDHKKREKLLNQANEDLEKNLVLHRELLAKKEENTSILQASRRSLDKAINEQALLRNMIESLEGFPESVKFVHNHTKGNIPLLSDLFMCPEDYKNGLENYLDQRLHFFVATNEEDALEAINLLKSGQKGRASFFILDRFQGKQHEILPNSILHQLKYEEKFHELFAYLFGNVVLTDGVKEGSYDFILADSTMIDKEFTISGGSVGLFEGKKVGRKKRYEALTKQIQKEEKTVVNLEEITKKIQSDLDAITLEDLRKRQLEADLAFNSLNFKVKDISERLEEEQAKGSLADKTEQEIEQSSIADQKELELLKAKIQEINASKAQRESLVDKQSAQLAELQSELGKRSEMVNRKNIEKIQQENLIIALTTEITGLTDQSTALQSQQETNAQELVATSQKLEELTQKAGSTTVKDQKLYEEQSQLKKKISDVEQLYFEEKSHIQEKERQLRELNSEHLNLQSTINQTKEREQTLKYELQGFFDRLNIEFGMSAKEVKKEIEEHTFEMDVQEAQLKLDKLELRIQNYGDINPMAITAYNEIQERYDYITGQKNDILKANDDLEQTIKEIEVEANAMFVDAFEQIKEHFKNVFRTFFTEDDACDLILLNEDSPLDSPIEILAKPKGKRPKSLSQLSGGEKTLTATALLFALYLLKPAPFCIFDEVDAPLDDLNVQKFTKLISQFSKNSQFVIITHNKVTMAAVDMLYGVFMQEVGISEISAVDFSDKSYDFNYQPILN